MPNSTPASASTRSGAAPGSWIQAREVDEFRYPTAHEVTVGVELFGLCRRVEDPKVRRGVGTGASDPLPVADVLGGVAVHQQATKVGFPQRQSTSRSFTRKEATIMRTRLCIQPVAAN